MSSAARFPRVTSAIALAAAATAVAAAPAGARPLPPRAIVPYKGAAGIRIGMHIPQVKHRLGWPSQVSRYHGRISWLQYNKLGVWVEFDTGEKHETVMNVQIDGRRYRTSKGIHVGSTLKAMRRAYPRARNSPGFRDEWDLIIHDGDVRRERWTSFMIENGKVDEIDVSTNLD